MPELRRLRSSYGGGSGGSSETTTDLTVLSSSSSSGSVSVDRSSSDAAAAYDHHHISSLQWSSAQGLDLDPKKNFNGSPYLIRKKLEKAEVAIKEYSDAETDGENHSLFSARSSFSHKEGQYRKSRSEILLRKSDRRRPASLDLNNQAMNVVSSSPRLGASMKSSGSSGRSGIPSPGTPNYRSTSFGVQKGWSSERVPLHTNANRVTFVPYNNGKNLPSKWEDAERWIISPATGDDALKPLVKQPQKRPKAKSGPLGPSGSAYYSMYSPAVASVQGENVKNFVTESSFPTGVNEDNSSMIQYQDGFDSNGNFHLLMDSSIARSSSVHHCSELLSQSLLRITQDDKIGGFIDAATDISRDVSRRDMATQMSPDSSASSSPRKNARRTPSSLTSSIPAVTDLQHVPSSKADTRDVQVDDRVTLTRYLKIQAQIPSKGSYVVDDWRNEGSDLEASEIKKSLSTVKREEAKITAWENLQKAKADEAIRKLEMKLEKKRSSSMDRIMQKLRSAQKKAQEMRESVLSNQSSQVAKSSHKVISLIKTRQIRSLSGCFTCPAF